MLFSELVIGQARSRGMTPILEEFCGTHILPMCLCGVISDLNCKGIFLRPNPPCVLEKSGLMVGTGSGEALGPSSTDVQSAISVVHPSAGESEVIASDVITM